MRTRHEKHNLRPPEWKGEPQDAAVMEDIMKIKAFYEDEAMGRHDGQYVARCSFESCLAAQDVIEDISLVQNDAGLQ